MAIEIPLNPLLKLGPLTSKNHCEFL